MRISGKIAVAFVLACASGGAFAKTWTVNVGGYTTSGGGGGYYGGGTTTTPVLMFNPSNLTINVGDSITFKNLGGVAEPHNVNADDGSFRCANGCDGQGGNGNPAANEWTSTVTFTKAGVVNFHCDEHQMYGMTGSVTVNDVAPPPPPPPTQKINGGISGNWSNPTANQGGHGFQIEILPNNGMLAIWFVFNPAGTAQNWIFALGNYDPNSNTATLPAVLEQGGAFPPNFDSTHLTQPAWGTLQFTFSDCNNGTAKYTGNDAAHGAGYSDVTFPIQRVTNIAGTTCQ